MLLIAAAALAVVQLGLPVPNPDRHGPWILLAGVSLCALCVGLRVDVPWLARIGASSYVIYLFHVFFTAASRIALAKAGLTLLPLQIVAGVALGVAAPMLVEHWAARCGAARLLLLGQSFRAAASEDSRELRPARRQRGSADADRPGPALDPRRGLPSIGGAPCAPGCWPPCSPRARCPRSRPMLRPAHLGANLPAISDWSATPVYVNLVHQARRFGTPDAPWDENAVLGSDGWPVGDFGIFLSTAQAGVAGTGGTYKVSFTGRANVAPVASAGASIANQAYDAHADRTTLDLVVDTGAPSGGNQLALKFTGTQGGIRNLKVIRPGYDPDDPPLFTSSFIDHIARFRTVRFMDWLRTNDNNGDARWASRPTPERVPYASPLGVPWEHVVALANRTGQDIWINIPLRADDDYVENLARLLKSTLNPGSRVYVEYSNELWNPGFAQFGGNLELARAEVEADPASALAFDKASRTYTVADPNVLAFRRIAKRLKEIADIFAGVFGAPAMLTRIRPVLAAQVVQPHVARIGLDFIRDTYGPPAHYFHALASAPYFNLGAQQTVDGLTAGRGAGRAGALGVRGAGGQLLRGQPRARDLARPRVARLRGRVGHLRRPGASRRRPPRTSTRAWKRCASATCTTGTRPAAGCSCGTPPAPDAGTTRTAPGS